MRIAFYLLIALIVIAAGMVAWAARYPEIEPIAAASTEPVSEAVQTGAMLAEAGNCITCHTAEDGQLFAGGVPIPTPFGTIYSTNITPDPETGIGEWSEAAFRRAMREGIDRQGDYLYPAFPYDHFTKLSDEDIGALYAYLMSRTPVEATAPENDLPFPFNMRMMVAGWNLLYLDRGPYEANSTQSEAWNRGGYLVEGLGHCGSCHTPRNQLGAEDEDRRFAGGQAEGWIGPALNGESPAPVAWSAEEIADYLEDGWQAQHGSALGPMAEVAHNIGQMPEEDLVAIGTYLASFQREQDDAAREDIVSAAEDRTWTVNELALFPTKDEAGRGETIFAGACATCHLEGGQTPFIRPAALGLSTSVSLDDPINFARVVMNGVHPPPGHAGPIMPGFANMLDDEAVTELAAYVRERFADKPAWDNVAEAAAEARENPQAN